ncbi:hypothetical protein J5N97_014283 [Dioscorea zingiberensis]|uniref:Glutamine amidotransferase type-2 domain-containing protein n=1 Tax=Dioscorea zingiberensis TaxID=325984 RepID=A0A9D5CTU4_9LILI|nr:hypothetical protein J5N97_014283 [Dioscorea zingiberensis]
MEALPQSLPTAQPCRSFLLPFKSVFHASKGSLLFGRVSGISYKSRPRQRSTGAHRRMGDRKGWSSSSSSVRAVLDLGRIWCHSQGFQNRFLVAKIGQKSIFLHSSSVDMWLVITKTFKNEGVEVLGWRPVPVNTNVVGYYAKETMPNIQQVLVKVPKEENADDIERELYICEETCGEGIKIRSLAR